MRKALGDKHNNLPALSFSLFLSPSHTHTHENSPINIILHFPTCRISEMKKENKRDSVHNDIIIIKKYKQNESRIVDRSHGFVFL